ELGSRMASGARFGLEQRATAGDRVRVFGPSRARRREALEVGDDCVDVGLVEGLGRIAPALADTAAEPLHRVLDAALQGLVLPVPLVGRRIAHASGQNWGLQDRVTKPPGQAVGPAFGVTVVAGHHALARNVRVATATKQLGAALDLGAAQAWG